ncbi:MAG: MlaD family protein [Alphaproteobacteria bacterium]|nr:MlaD family protein [Alphaproteobacteria bacterium]
MESQPNYTIVGLFVIGFMLGIVAFVIWMARMDIEGQSAIYDIYFEGSVTGLRVNEQVRYHGLPIGYLTALEVDKEDPELIRVRVKISEPSLIREDTIASIEAKGLTGYSYIQIVGGNSNSPLLKAKKGEYYPRIKSRQSKIEELFSGAPKVMRRLIKLTETLNKFFDKETNQILKDTLVETKEAAKAIGTAFAKIETHASRITTDFNKITSEVDRTAGTLRDLAMDTQGVIRNNKDAIETFTNNGLFAFSKLMTETSSAVEGLNRVVGQIEKSPGDFLNKNLDKGVRID